MTPAVLRHLVRRDGRRFRHRMERQMSMSDTTPTNAHEAAIRESLSAIRDSLNEHQPVNRQHIMTIRDHAEALARDFAAERARVARLRAAYLDAENDSVVYALPEHNANNPHKPVTAREWFTAIREAHLDPGDLDEREPMP